MASKVASIRSVKRRSVLARGLRPTESLGIVPMHVVFASLPLAAAFLAVPQFLPQLARVRRAGTMAGVSWSWAALTSVNNAAWLAYFALSGFWTALVPAVSATVLSGWLAAVLARRGGGVPKRPMVLVSVWAVVLLTATAVFGRAG